MMARIFMQGGVLMFPIAAIAIVVASLVIRTVVDLRARGRHSTARIQGGLDGLLFWGAFASISGFLGTVTGYHKAMAAVVARGVVNPPAVWIGMAEGLVSTIAGLLVLGVSVLAWFLLRRQFRRSRLTG